MELVQNSSVKLRSYWVAIAVGVGLVSIRCLPFIFRGEANLNSDEAVFGLMAKHISEGTAYPIFMYGQKYLFGISSWLVAPWMKWMGPSVGVIKGYLFVLNLIVAIGLFNLLFQTSRLRAWQILLCLSFFLFPSSATSFQLMEFSGGHIEPFVFVLGIWSLRRTGILLGLVSAIGVLNRPFALYALLALLILDSLQQRWKSLAYWVLRTRALIAFSLTYIVIKSVGERGSEYFGNGNLVRFLKPLRHIFEDFRWFLAEGVPRLFGLETGLGIESHFTIGTVLLGSAILIGIGVGLKSFLSGRKKKLGMLVHSPEAEFPIFLILTGLICMGAYALFSPALGEVANIRYIFLFLLLPIGLGVFVFRFGSVRLRYGFSICALLLVLCNLFDFSRTASSELALQRIQSTRNLLDYLDRRNLHCGFAEYWTAYRLSFLSRENIRFTVIPPRIHAYDRYLNVCPESQRFSLEKRSCPGGRQEFAHIEEWLICKKSTNSD